MRCYRELPRPAYELGCRAQIVVRQNTADNISSTVSVLSRVLTKPMDLSIIIVSWLAPAHIGECVRSIFRNTRGITFEVLIIQESTLIDLQGVTQSFPSCVLLEGKSLEGIARANNLAASRAQGTSLLFLHPATMLIENSLRTLVNQLRALPNAGALGCQLINEDQTIQANSVQSFPTLLNQVLESEYLRERFPESKLWGMKALHVDWPRLTEVEAVSGACLIVSKSHFERVQGFSQQYSMFREDLDLCFKLRQSGAQVYHVPETRVVHRGGRLLAPTERTAVSMKMSTFHFMRLHRGFASAATYRTAMAVSSIARLAVMGPLMLLGRQVVRHGSQSWRKWVAILFWAIGLRNSAADASKSS
jgi:N-acetylglucosaminyl-diphospho-decaprenol L-rhamnosyltransferase